MMMGYVREWGEAGSLQLFVNHDLQHVLTLDDNRLSSPEDVLNELAEQGVNMEVFRSVIRNLDFEDSE